MKRRHPGAKVTLRNLKINCEKHGGNKIELYSSEWYLLQIIARI